MSMGSLMYDRFILCTLTILVAKGATGLPESAFQKAGERSHSVQEDKAPVPEPERDTISMLGDSDFISFISTARPEAASRFYVSILGLELVSDEPLALVFRGNGRLLRMQKLKKVPPPTGTALGWQVRDIAAKVRQLEEKGVRFERYDGLPQDDLGIATFPNGDKVAWFLDPDGNILSLSQLVRSK